MNNKNEEIKTGWIQKRGEKGVAIYLDLIWRDRFVRNSKSSMTIKMIKKGKKPCVKYLFINFLLDILFLIQKMRVLSTMRKRTL